MVPRRRRGGGVARVEAEHDRSAGALSGGFPVRALYWDADPHGLGRNPVLRRAFHQQCGEHRRDELLVPWTSQALGWWLKPPKESNGRVDLAGAALMFFFYGVL